MYQEIYYATYFALCAALVFAVGYTLHRSGGVFLADTFAGNPALAHAVAHLLDVGFYLFSIGYVAVMFRPYMMLNYGKDVVQAICSTVGGFMITMAFVHCFNLLLLAILRHRSARAARAGALS